MSNQILTISMITRESLRVLENNLTFAKGINRKYDDQFAIGGAKIGDTINIRKPARYVGRTGPALSLENHTETSVPLTLDTQFGVDIVFTSKDLTLSMDDFSQRFLEPALATVANKIDSDGLLLYRDVFNSVGTPGTTPNTLLTYLQAGVKMKYEAAPVDNMRSMVIDPIAEATIVDALKGLFHATTEIEEQYKQGKMGMVGGFKWSMDQNVIHHTIGTYAGTPLVNGASQTGASLITDGWASGASSLTKGDVFTLANVFAVNPQNRRSTGQLRQFVVTATISDTSGAMTLGIYPPIIGPNSDGSVTQFQTVNALPADNAAITVYGASGTQAVANLAYHRDAFTLGCADLVLPGGVDMASRVSDDKLGMSVRMVRAYDINQDRFPCRLDVLYGYKTIYPELACRVEG